MKIKYKLISIFIIITLFALLPVSILQTRRQEEEKMAGLKRQGEIISQFLAHSVMNTILANGADFQASRIDVKETFSLLKSLAGDGLTFSEATLVSSNKNYRGFVLATFNDEKKPVPDGPLRNITPAELVRIKEPWSWFREIELPGRSGKYYEFTAVGFLPGNSPVCVCRMLYSEKIILEPIRKMRLITMIIVVLAIFFVALLGYIASRLISEPIVRLTNATQKIEDGDFSLNVPTQSNDEIGHLSRTINHMLRLIKTKIAELEDSNKRLLELDVLKDEFLANTSHELRTPLYGMVGIAESLVFGASGALNPDALYNIRMIIASGKRLENIVNDILDFSRMKHHDLRLSLHRVDMYDVTQFVLSIVRPLVGSKSLVIENRIEPEKIIVSGDDGRLQQILMNLVGNAVKFSESGTVQVSAVMNESDQKAVITVTDTGIGIPSDQHDQIFEPFHQGDGSVARSHGGTGLGLAVTKKLIELHGGKIWFDSKPGSGSSFSFSLVLYDGTADQSASAKEIEGREKLRSMTFDAVTSSPAGHLMRLKSESGAAGRAKILVVDDEPINILIVINHLLMEGYEVSTAENGEQVDEFFSRGDIPDLILLDVMLPRISGFDVCRRIREKFPSHELPIIMLTARQTTRDIVAGISAGANDYLIKPVSGEELLARVGNLISMKNSVKLQGELKIIKNELTLAMELQKSIFPSSVPVLPGIGFAARFVPSSHVSGDFYDYHVRDLENIDIIVADIAGHGIPAAMIASMMQMAYGSLKKKNNTPSENLSEINAIMNVYPDGVYLTACCVHIDIAGRRMRFSSAGHPPVLVYRKSENTVLSFSVFGRPIGMFEDAVYTTDEISLEPGDRIVLYTDGITEAWNPDHVAYGEERFKSLILDNVRMDVEAFSDRVVDAVTSWSMVTSGRGLSDDVTFLVVDFIG